MKDLLRKYSKEINNFLENALREDIGSGDVTTDFLIPSKTNIKGMFVAKSEGVICGVPLIKLTLQKLNKEIKIINKKKDGDIVKTGDVIAVVKGNARAILSGERVVLNIIQRLSGIATTTKKFVDIAKPYKVTILDTRKTTPNLRILEKYAVTVGGGQNHRMGLYDAALIKNNHLKIVNLEKAVYELRRWLPKDMTIEIEVHDLEILKKAIELCPDIIMLDNMGLSMVDEAMKIIKQSHCKSKIEISGGINLHNIRDYAQRKPDFISLGTITHSPQAMDIHFKLLA